MLAAESGAQRVVEAIRRIPGASTYLQVIDATCFTDFTSLNVNDVAWRRLTREKQHPPFSEKDFKYPERTVVLPPEPGRPWRQGGNPVVSAWAAASAWEVRAREEQPVPAPTAEQVLGDELNAHVGEQLLVHGGEVHTEARRSPGRTEEGPCRTVCLDGVPFRSATQPRNICPAQPDRKGT